MNSQIIQNPTREAIDVTAWKSGDSVGKIRNLKTVRNKFATNKTMYILGRLMGYSFFIFRIPEGIGA
jgi:hypothetical protein